MASSSYYYAQMMDYSQSKRVYENKKIEYQTYLEKLELLHENLDIAGSNLEQSESNFLNGGYVNDGISLDNGLLKESYKDLEKTANKLNKLINKTKDEIESIDTNITLYKKKYKIASDNYKKAKKEEMK